METPEEKILPSALAFLITETVFLEETCEMWYLQKYSSKKDKSLSTIIFSARKGMPLRPSLVDISPSFIGDILTELKKIDFSVLKEIDADKINEEKNKMFHIALMKIL